MRRVPKILFLCLLCCLLTGCHTQPEEPLRLVSRIQIDHTGPNTPAHAVYTDATKMETILFYLRHLNPRGHPDTDPERIIGDQYRISISFSDGTRRIYRQQANRFLSVDGHPWKKVDPKKGSLLPLLLGILPPDQETYSTNVNFSAISPASTFCTSSTRVVTRSV